MRTLTAMALAGIASFVQAQSFRPASSPNFGTVGTSWIRIGPTEFVSLNPASALPVIGLFPDNNEYILYPTGTVGYDFLATVHLPDGALITQMMVSSCDTHPPFLPHIDTSLVECDVIGANCTLLGHTNSVANSIPCDDVSVTEFIPHTVDSNVLHEYFLQVSIPANDGSLGLNSIAIGYQLQVSPPPGVPTFNDVPLSDPAFQFIEAFTRAGITAGCSAAPPLYCPDAPVTRRQMAVFFAKALGLDWSLP